MVLPASEGEDAVLLLVKSLGGFGKHELSANRIVVFDPFVTGKPIIEQVCFYTMIVTYHFIDSHKQ